ncbi:MAG: RraA family protein [Chloroflexota bacterium]
MTLVTDELIERYRTLPPATIGHFTGTEILDSGIKPLFTPLSIVGRARTVRLPRGDGAMVRPAIQSIQPGDVLVMDQDGDDQVTSWGEMTSLAAKMKGCVGVIIEGSVTDWAEIRAQQMPTFARAIVARIGHRLDQPEGALQVPISVGGVIVNPGDLVVADDNGIIIMSAERAEELYAVSRASEDRAPLVRRWLEAGGDLAELAGLTGDKITAMLEERGW